MSETTLRFHDVMDAVRRSVRLDLLALPAEFFPAHLSVALIDALVQSPLGGGETQTAGDRYCRRFGLARVRVNRGSLPPIEEQETLQDLIRRYDELGTAAMTDLVFAASCNVIGTGTEPAEVVRRGAEALLRAGVRHLQHARYRTAGSIKTALRPIPGVGAGAIRRLLMYTGDDDFALGDACIRRFVACALGRRTVSVEDATAYVRATAYELILAPRFLDYRIWEYANSEFGTAEPRMAEPPLLACRRNGSEVPARPSGGWRSPAQWTEASSVSSVENVPHGIDMD